MAQWLNVPAAQADDLRSDPGPHMAEGENRLSHTYKLENVKIKVKMGLALYGR